MTRLQTILAAQVNRFNTWNDKTDIIVSNIGRLGLFKEKSLNLRPGEYTIRGSQDGCRDLFLSVLVVPGIEPIDLRCQDRL